jgi:hypothetical protein
MLGVGSHVGPLGEDSPARAPHLAAAGPRDRCAVPRMHSTKRDIVIFADNGTESLITGKAAQQGADQYQSARVHRVWLDEEHPEAVYDEMQPRLLDSAATRWHDDAAQRHDVGSLTHLRAVVAGPAGSEAPLLYARRYRRQPVDEARADRRADDRAAQQPVDAQGPTLRPVRSAGSARSGRTRTRCSST